MPVLKLPSSFPARLQDLAPSGASLCLSVQRFMQRTLCFPSVPARVLVGFSGGADSTALLLILHWLSFRMGITVCAAHLDHRLRPSSADEADRCRLFCEALGVPFKEGKAALPDKAKLQGVGLEEAARTARYEFLAQTADESGCGWVALGHQQNDLAEDILMRLLRGAGWPALSGMVGIDAERRLIRPLLLTPRTDLENFLRHLGITWVEDESNADTSLLRNRVRHTLLPLFLKENPSFMDSAAGLWRLGRADSEFFTNVVPLKPEGFLSRDHLSAMPKALRLRHYKKELDALGGGQALLNSLLALDESFERKGEPSRHRFSGGREALISSKGILFSRAEKDSPLS